MLLQVSEYFVYKLESTWVKCVAACVCVGYVCKCMQNREFCISGSFCCCSCTINGSEVNDLWIALYQSVFFRVCNYVCGTDVVSI